jgi:hypothetical protein
MDLESYRRSAEEFVCALTAEYYRHYAGLKESYEIEPIYERHRELFGAGAVDDLRGRVDHREIIGRQHAIVGELGYPSHREMCAGDEGTRSRRASRPDIGVR